jgi:isoleucyl-tRNA synthetase
LAADGEKLSKRKKNFPDPNLLFETKGVDSMRMFFYTGPAVLADDVRFTEKHVEDLVKKFTLTLWNTYSFFVTYANIDKWDPQKIKKGFMPAHKLDQWILSELNQLIVIVTTEMENYNLMKATRPMLDFVDNLSNWYIRRSRRRFWKSENDADKNEAYLTLYNVLVDFVKLLAPFMPFIAEEIYLNLTGKESVHLENWPKVKGEYIQTGLNFENRIVRQIVTLGHSVRDKANIKVRQPLALVQIGLPANVPEDVVMSQKEVICEELNVKNLFILKDVQEFVIRVVVPNAKVLGPKYGRDVQEIINKAKSGDFEILEEGGVNIGGKILSGDEVYVGFQGKEGYDVASGDGISVILDTNISDALKEEGCARDLVRTIQDLRKEADYDVDERIYIYLEAGNPVNNAILNFGDYIIKETLAIEMQDKGDFNWDKEKVIEMEGCKVKVAVRK